MACNFHEYAVFDAIITLARTLRAAKFAGIGARTAFELHLLRAPFVCGPAVASRRRNVVWAPSCYRFPRPVSTWKDVNTARRTGCCPGKWSHINQAISPAVYTSFLALPRDSGGLRAVPFESKSICSPCAPPDVSTIFSALFNAFSTFWLAGILAPCPKEQQGGRC